MYFVTIKGNDLTELEGFAQRLLSGELGKVNEVRLSVSDNGIMFGTNGFATNHIGEIDREANVLYETVSADEPAETVVPVRDSVRIAGLERRVAQLEQLAAGLTLQAEKMTEDILKEADKTT